MFSVVLFSQPPGTREIISCFLKRLLSPGEIEVISCFLCRTLWAGAPKRSAVFCGVSFEPECGNDQLIQMANIYTTHEMEEGRSNPIPTILTGWRVFLDRIWPIFYLNKKQAKDAGRNRWFLHSLGLLDAILRAQCSRSLIGKCGPSTCTIKVLMLQLKIVTQALSSAVPSDLLPKTWLAQSGG